MKKNRKTRITRIKDLYYWLDQEQGTYIVQEKIGFGIFGFWKDVAIFDSLPQAERFIASNYR